MKFSGKLCHMIILKDTKKQRLSLSLKNKVLKKTMGWGQLMVKINVPKSL